jgi:hypothetical protein
MRGHLCWYRKEKRHMHSKNPLPSIWRSVIVLGLLATASVAGARPAPIGAAPVTVDRIQALQTTSAVRASAPASFALKITPDSGIGQGDMVLISGNAPVDAANQPVKVVVTLPSGVQTGAGSVPIRQTDGFFTLCFNLTGQPGTYHVRVQSSAGSAVGTTTFKVDPGFGPPDPDPELGKLGVDIEHHIEGLLRALPDSPAAEDLQAKLDDLRPRMATALKQIQKYSDSLQEVLGTIKDFPRDRPQFEGLLKQLGDWNDKAKAMEATLRDEMRADDAGTVRCDDVAHLERELTALVGLITELQGPMHALADFEDKYKAGTGLGLEDNIQCLNWQEEVTHLPFDPKLRDALDKIDPADAPVAFMDALLKVANDAVAAGSQDLFSFYCEQFAGPFTASLAATISDKGTAWWKYTIGLQGTLTLRYTKGATGQGPIKLTGEFEGDANNFSVSENALRVLYPKLVTGALLFHKAILPDTPIHFSLPVEGEISGKMLTINPPGEGSDATTGAVAHVTYVVVTPLTLVPQVVKFDLPYVSARTVIGRAMSDKPAQFPITVSRQAKVSTISKVLSYTRNHPGAVAYGQYKLTVRACNPTCSQ